MPRLTRIASCFLGSLFAYGCASDSIDFPPPSGAPLPCVAYNAPAAYGPESRWARPDTVYSPVRAGTASDGGVERCDLTGMAIAVRRQGRFRQIYGPQDGLPGDDLRGDLEAARALDPLFARLSKSPVNQPLRIAIVAHGGNSDHDGAVRGAEALAPAMLFDGLQPVFLIWNSDFMTAYRDRLCCVRDGQRSRAGVEYLAPARVIGDLGASVPRAIENFGRQAFRTHQSSRPNAGSGSRFFLSGEEREMALRTLPQGPRRDLIIYPAYPGGPRSYPEFLNDRASSPIAAVGAAATLPFRAVATSLFSEVGARAWDNMVRRTRIAFDEPAPDLETKPVGRHCVTPSQGLIERKLERRDPLTGLLREERGGAFSFFFERLQCEINFGSLRGRDVTVDFYGHSMGAILGNEALSRYDELPWRRVVYMAAATTVRDFELTGARVIAEEERKQPIQFYSLMLHPLTEARESNRGGVVPRGSLLEWIDEMFEGPRSPDDRMFGKWLNLQRSLRLFNDDQLDRMTFRVFPSQETVAALGPTAAPCVPAPGQRVAPIRCHPIKHGEFNDYTFWRQAYLTGGGDGGVPPPSARTRTFVPR